MFALIKNYSVARNSSQPNAKQNKVKPQTLNHKNDISDSVNFVAYGSRLGQNIKHGILFFQMEAHTKAFNVSVINVYTQILIVYIFNIKLCCLKTTAHYNLHFELDEMKYGLILSNKKNKKE